MTLLKSVFKTLLIVSVLLAVPAYAKKPRQVSVSQDRILATNYVVQDLDTGEIILEQASGEVRSIASITKLMTAMVVLDAGQDLDEMIAVKSIKYLNRSIYRRISCVNCIHS